MEVTNGQVWLCEVTPNDGIEEGTLASASLTAGNPPFSSCRAPPDIVDEPGDAVEMDIIKVERCPDGTAPAYEYFKTTFSDGTLLADSLLNGGFLTLKIEGEEQSGKFWCIYMRNDETSGKTQVKLTETTSGGTCDESETTTLSDILYEYDEGDFFVVYDYTAGKGFELDTVNDFMTVMYKSGNNPPTDLIGSIALLFLSLDTGGALGNGQVPEFTTVGVLIALLAVTIGLGFLVMRRK